MVAAVAECIAVYPYTLAGGNLWGGRERGEREREREREREKCLSIFKSETT